MEYILIRDNDGHWFVIPEMKQSNFNKWLEQSYDEDAWDIPEYAKEVGGSQTLVKFKEYRIG